MKIAYDFHIHSCLSPCASDEMTPNNIVGMAVLKELGAIAVTDHNTGGNVPAVLRCAETCGLTVFPGMELETQEEVHMLCLFRDPARFFSFESAVRRRWMRIPNRKEIFGNQLILDEEDRVIGEEENLLITACSLSVDEAVSLCREMGGLILPAHIDRSSNSILSQLGFIAPDYGFSVYEISARAAREAVLGQIPEAEKCLILQDSDAHYLEDISEPVHFLEVEENSPDAIWSALLGVKNM